MIKKTFTVLLFLTFVGCQLTNNKLKISGIIEDAASDTLKIEGINFSQIIVLNNGSFEEFINLPYSGIFTLKFQDNQTDLFLDNVFNLKLNAKNAGFDQSLIFEGKGAEENNYIQEKNKIITQVYGNLNGWDGISALYQLPENDFLKKHEDYKTKITNLLSSKKFTHQNFEVLEIKDISFKTYAINHNYKNYHAYITENPEFEVSVNFPKIPDDFDFFDETYYYFSKTYRGLVTTHFFSNIFDQVDNDETVEPFKLIVAGLKNIKSKLIRSELVSEIYDELATSTQDLDKIVEDLISYSLNEEVKNEIRKIHQELKSLSAGKHSPEFNFEDINGNMVSSESLKGKYVYIDVWATWCKPCIAEVPSLKKIIASYKNKKIQFVGISVNEQKDKQKWIKMVQDKNLEGYQLLADKDWNSDFAKQYNINSIPRFILIDPNGNIVDADAPRPSDSELINLLKSLDI